MKNAHRELNKLDPVFRSRIIRKLNLLAENPEVLQNNVKRLKGELTDYYRLRVADYRVIYTIEDEKLLILVVRVAHRREVY